MHALNILCILSSLPQGWGEELEHSVNENPEKRLPNIFEIILNLPPGIRGEPSLSTHRLVPRYQFTPRRRMKERPRMILKPLHGLNKKTTDLMNGNIWHTSYGNKNKRNREKFEIKNKMLENLVSLQKAKDDLKAEDIYPSLKKASPKVLFVPVEETKTNLEIENPGSSSETENPGSSSETENPDSSSETENPDSSSETEKYEQDTKSEETDSDTIAGKTDTDKNPKTGKYKTISEDEEDPDTNSEKDEPENTTLEKEDTSSGLVTNEETSMKTEKEDSTVVNLSTETETDNSTINSETESSFSPLNTEKPSTPLNTESPSTPLNTESPSTTSEGEKNKTNSKTHEPKTSVQTLTTTTVRNFTEKVALSSNTVDNNTENNSIPVTSKPSTIGSDYTDTDVAAKIKSEIPETEIENSTTENPERRETEPWSDKPELKNPATTTKPGTVENKLSPFTFEQTSPIDTTKEILSTFDTLELKSTTNIQVSEPESTTAKSIDGSDMKGQDYGTTPNEINFRSDNDIDDELFDSDSDYDIKNTEDANYYDYAEHTISTDETENPPTRGASAENKISEKSILENSTEISRDETSSTLEAEPTSLETKTENLIPNDGFYNDPYNSGYDEHYATTVGSMESITNHITKDKKKFETTTVEEKSEITSELKGSVATTQATTTEIFNRIDLNEEDLYYMDQYGGPPDKTDTTTDKEKSEITTEKEESETTIEMKELETATGMLESETNTVIKESKTTTVKEFETSTEVKESETTTEIKESETTTDMKESTETETTTEKKESKDITIIDDETTENNEFNFTTVNSTGSIANTTNSKDYITTKTGNELTDLNKYLNNVFYSTTTNLIDSDNNIVNQTSEEVEAPMTTFYEPDGTNSSMTITTTTVTMNSTFFTPNLTKNNTTTIKEGSTTVILKSETTTMKESETPTYKEESTTVKEDFETTAQMKGSNSTTINVMESETTLDREESKTNTITEDSVSTSEINDSVTTTQALTTKQFKPFDLDDNDLYYMDQYNAPPDKTDKITDQDNTEITTIETTTEKQESETTTDMMESETTTERNEPETTTEIRKSETTKKMKEFETTTEMRESETTTKMKESETTTEMKESETTTEMMKSITTTVVQESETTKEMKESETTTGMKEFETTTEMKESETITEMKKSETSTKLKESETTTEIKESETTTEMNEPETTTKIKASETNTEMKTSETTTEMNEPETTTKIKASETTTEMKESEITPEIKKSETITEMKESETTTEIKKSEATTEMKELKTAPGDRQDSTAGDRFYEDAEEIPVIFENSYPFLNSDIADNKEKEDEQTESSETEPSIIKASTELPEISEPTRSWVPGLANTAYGKINPYIPQKYDNDLGRKGEPFTIFFKIGNSSSFDDSPEKNPYQTFKPDTGSPEPVLNPISTLNYQFRNLEELDSTAPDQTKPSDLSTTPAGLDYIIKVTSLSKNESENPDRKSPGTDGPEYVLLENVRPIFQKNETAKAELPQQDYVNSEKKVLEFIDPDIDISSQEDMNSGASSPEIKIPERWSPMILNHRVNPPNNLNGIKDAIENVLSNTDGNPEDLSSDLDKQLAAVYPENNELAKVLNPEILEAMKDEDEDKPSESSEDANILAREAGTETQGVDGTENKDRIGQDQGLLRMLDPESKTGSNPTTIDGCKKYKTHPGRKREGLRLLGVKGSYSIKISKVEDCKKHIEDMWRAGEWLNDPDCGLALVGISKCTNPACCMCTVTKNESCAATRLDEKITPAEQQFLKLFSNNLSNSIPLDTPGHCNNLKEKLKGSFRDEFQRRRSSLKCTDKRGPGRRSNPDPDQKIEIFFLAKFINTKKICTITVKIIRGSEECEFGE
ncbi:mucin-12 isoform X3 [Eurytemora carolleeae]|uniref:mucin-12 isoform X3 n=1 Tax=Eurytemora carolleeae TaxID=1294199 RepID=UPI000C769BAC|nr:mucin-12 isoform X3 [Eurytemora carolleeae]|eukprot:XP_023329926.1 mucin-12-like isoform X3 [Eurytemora affinis]